MYGLPFVGDLGGADERPEVVVVGGSSSSIENTILIFDHNLTHLKTINIGGYMYTYGGFPMVLVKPSSTAKPRVIVAINGASGELYQLKSFDIDGNLLASSNISIAANKYYNSSTFYRHTPYLSVGDINGDGKVELLVHNKIYDAESLELILTIGQTYNDLKGIGLAYPYARGDTHSAILADVDNDGVLDVVAGNSVYKIDIAAKTSQRIADVNELDGFTSIADIDLDGYVDVVVVTKSGTRVQMYAWSPHKGIVLGKSAAYTEHNTDNGYSRAFIGDFNNDGTPNVAFTTFTNGIIALKYNEPLAKFDELWSPIKTSEFSSSSGVTSLTIFDFNNDGIPELLHRDSKHLRILNAANPDPNNPLALISAPSSSGTEFPIVADLDGDGHADILISSNPNLSSGVPNVYKGELRWFSSKTANSWAAARKVWNQYAYNAVNVNEDLTIPKVQFSMATPFAGPNETLGDIDDVRPFNGFLQQQTILNHYGTPLWPTPKAEIVNIPTFSYDESSGGKMIISLQVKNTGSNQFQNPFYVSAFRDAIGSSPNYTYKYENTIDVGETATLTFTLENFDTVWTPNDFLIIKINAKADGLTDQEVCDEDNTLFFYYGLLPTGQEVCKDNIGEMESVFTHYPHYTYQWQYSINETTWMDIAGATTGTYTPVYQDPGIGYYRMKITDSNDPENIVYHYTASVKVISRRCVMPVNPNIHILK